MKKIFLVMFMFMLMFITINAEGETDDTSEDKTVYAKVDEATFDFSGISFACDGNDEAAIKGDTNLKKIWLNDSSENNNWFTAYCLDKNKKYPEIYNIGNVDENDTTFDLAKLKTLIFYTFTEDVGYEGADQIFEDVLNHNFYADGSTIKICEEESCDTALDDTFISSYKEAAQGELFSFLVESLAFINNVDINDSLIIEDFSEYCDKANEETDENEVICKDGKPIVKLYKSSTNKYKVYEAGNSRIDNHVLWIMEHSYPTFEVEESLSNAYEWEKEILNMQAILDTINVDESLEGEDKITAQKNILKEYVYSTIQYAIWYVKEATFSIDGDTNKYKLGNSILIDESSSELVKALDILYRYLIKDRDEYETYNEVLYSNNINLIKPSIELSDLSGNDNLVYGPYYFTSNMLTTNSIIITEDVENVSFANEDGNIKDNILELMPGEKFYVVVSKNSNITKVKLDISATGTNFAQNTNRGKLYKGYSLFNQIVGTGGKYISDEFDDSIILDFNPKTGVKDMTKILLVFILSFIAGYLVLRLKKSPIKEI